MPTVRPLSPFGSHFLEYTANDISSLTTGIKWPLALAPYKAVIIPMVTKTDTSLADTAQEIYDLLESKASEVARGDIVIDDRIDSTAGFKMKEAALIGYPYVIILGKSYKNEGTIEVEERRTGKKSYLTPNQLVDFFNNMKT
jgi:prolyl-tRNA synthetase